MDLLSHQKNPIHSPIVRAASFIFLGKVSFAKAFEDEFWCFEMNPECKVKDPKLLSRCVWKNAKTLKDNFQKSWNASVFLTFSVSVRIKTIKINAGNPLARAIDFYFFCFWIWSVSRSIFMYLFQIIGTCHSFCRQISQKMFQSNLLS